MHVPKLGFQPVVKRTKHDFLTPPESGLRITWLGHSSTLVEIDGRRLLLCPVWSQRSSPYTWAGPKRFFDIPLSLDELPPIDGVLISHDHYDHLDKPTFGVMLVILVLFSGSSVILLRPEC
jgi:L-ascorbate metabolism protein UlaG (beta-lactamase superfamily)